MKQIFLSICVVIVSGSFAQESDEKTRLGVQIIEQGRFYYGWDNLGLSITPQITFTKKKHQFELGPSWFVFNDPRETKLGAFGGYRLYPNGFENRLNTVLSLTMPINYYKREPTSYSPASYIPYPDSVISFSYLSTTLQFGYGVNVAVTKKFYLASDFSMGFGNIFSKTRYISSQEVNYRTKSGYTLSLYFVFSLYLGFRF